MEAFCERDTTEQDDVTQIAGIHSREQSLTQTRTLNVFQENNPGLPKVSYKKLLELIPKSENGNFSPEDVKTAFLDYFKLDINNLNGYLAKEIKSLSENAFSKLANKEKWNEVKLLNIHYSTALKEASLTSQSKIGAGNSEELHSSIDALKTSLKSLNLRELKRVGFDSLDLEWPTWMNDRPGDFKDFLIKKAGSNALILARMVESCKKIKDNIDVMEMSLTNLSTFELNELKKTFGMSTTSKKTKAEIRKQLVNKARAYEGSSEDLLLSIDRLETRVSELKQVAIEKNRVTVEENVSTSQLCRTLSSDQVMKIAAELRIQIPNYMNNRAKDILTLIEKASASDQNQKAHFDQLKMDYKILNTELNFLADFTHKELYDLSKSLGMDISNQTNTSQLCKSVAKFITTNNFSLPDLLLKMQQRNQKVEAMVKYLNSLKRPELKDLKNELGMKSSKGNKSKSELSSQIVKYAEKCSITTTDLQELTTQMKMREEELIVQNELLQTNLTKDLEMLNDVTFYNIYKHLHGVHLMTREYLMPGFLKEVLENEDHLKFTTSFLDYHFFMMTNHYNMLSEMDLEGLKTIALEMDVPYVAQFGSNGLIYHLMEKMKDKSFTDFKEIASIDKFSFNVKDYISEADGRFKEKPEWVKLKEPGKLNEISKLLSLQYLDSKQTKLMEKYMERRYLCLMNLTQQWKIMYQLPCSREDYGLSTALKMQQKTIFDFLEWDNPDNFDHKSHLANFNPSWKEKTELFVKDHHEEIIMSLNDNEIQQAIKEFCDQDASKKYWDIVDNVPEITATYAKEFLKPASTAGKHLDLYFWNIVIQYVKKLNDEIKQLHIKLMLKTRVNDLLKLNQ